jgi:hypothetical protein
MTVSGWWSITSSRPGQHGGFDRGRHRLRPRRAQPEQEERDRDGGIVELKSA